MSKERKLRRAEREAAQQAARLSQARRDARRASRRRAWQRLTLHELRVRRTGRVLARRSRGERALIAVVAAAGLFVIWQLVPSLGFRVALSVLFVLTLPVFVVVVFDRRSS